MLSAVAFEREPLSHYRCHGAGLHDWLGLQSQQRS